MFQGLNPTFVKVTGEKLIGGFFAPPILNRVQVELLNVFILKKRTLVMNGFFSAQFSYCTVICMFYNRSFNHKINRLHKRCLHVTFNDNYSSYEESLNKDSFLKIRHTNLQILTKDMFSFYTKSTPNILNEVFLMNPESLFNFRNQQTLATRPIHEVHHGLDLLN